MSDERHNLFGINSPQKLHHLGMSRFAWIRKENSARSIHHVQQRQQLSQIDGILCHFHNLTVDKAKQLIDTALSLDLQQGEIEETSCAISGWLTCKISLFDFAGSFESAFGSINRYYSV